MQEKLPLLITTGEPAGIGMDIVLLLATEGKLQDFDRPVWVTADSKAMQKRADQLIAAGILKSCPPWQTINAHEATIEDDDFLHQMSQQSINSGTVNDDNAFILFNCSRELIASMSVFLSNGSPMMSVSRRSFSFRSTSLATLS